MPGGCSDDDGSSPRVRGDSLISCAWPQLSTVDPGPRRVITAPVGAACSGRSILGCRRGAFYGRVSAGGRRSTGAGPISSLLSRAREVERPAAPAVQVRACLEHRGQVGFRCADQDRPRALVGQAVARAVQRQASLLDSARPPKSRTLTSGAELRFEPDSRSIPRSAASEI